MFDHDDAVACDPIPAGLDRMEPGPVLAGFLASIDVDRVSGHDRVIVLRAQQRMASHHQAEVYAAMASLQDHMERDLFRHDPDLAWEAASTEIRAALRLTRRSAEQQLDLATSVRRRLPAVWAALAGGEIDRARARVLVHETSHLDEATARTVAARVICDAPRYTTGQLAARLRRLCIEVDPGAAADRYTEAVVERRVVVEGTPDGTAHLYGLDLPPHRVAEVARRINRLAQSLRAGDSRSMDQLRADVFLDLLSGSHQDSKGGVVDIRVDLETLTELSDAPGELAGYGPVIADIARRVARAQANGRWRFTITDPATGRAIHDGTTRRRPTPSQRRTVEARDRCCIFPGCRMPATQCDLDHRTPWAHDHHTTTTGLDAACRHDHVTVRHALGWTHRPLPGGDHLWTSPLGHAYTTSGLPP